MATAPLFKLEGTIAIPLDSNTLGLFQGLQRAINQAGSGLKLRVEEVVVDGDLGPKTMAAAKTIATAMQRITPNAKLAAVVTAPQTLAQNAQFVTLEFAKAFAFQPDFTPEPAKANRIVTQSTALSPNGPSSLPEPLSPGIHKEGGVPKWLWIVGGLGLVGFGTFFAVRKFRGHGASATFSGGDEFGYEEAAGDFIDV